MLAQAVAMVSGIAGQCPAIDSPSLRMEWNTRPPAIETALSIADLAAIKQEQAAVQDHSVRVGMYDGKIQIAFDVRGAGIAPCAFFKTIHVTLTLAPVIYVAREYAPGSCNYGAILAHEKLHLATDKALLEKYLPRMQDEISLAFADGLAGADATPDDLGPIVAGFVDRQISRLRTERLAMQAVVDSKENYAALTAQCAR